MEAVVNTVVELESGCDDVEELVELAIEEEDEETFQDAENEAKALVASLKN